MVVGVHAAPVLAPDAPDWLGGFLAHGQVAVDLFFVLSGFVLARAHGGLRARGVPRFLWRRAWRIYPLHVAVLGVLAAYVLHATAEGDRFIAPDFPWQRFAPTLLLLQPFLFRGATGWNPPDWSIAIEMLCALAFWPALAGLRRVGQPRLVAGILAVAAGADLAVNGGATAGWAAVLRGGCGFGFGVALALARLDPPMAAGCSATAASGLTCFAWWDGTGVELVVGGVFLGSVAADLPAVSVLASGALIILLAREGGALSRRLAGRGAAGLGRLSFSVYLVHVPLLIPFEGGWVLDLAWPRRMAVDTAYLLAVGGVSILTRRWIELPGRTVGSWPGRVRRPQHRTAATPVLPVWFGRVL